MPTSQDYSKRIVRSLRQLTQYLERHSRMLFEHQGVTVPQIMCLDNLIENGVMTMAVLATNIHVSPSTMAGIVDRLEKKKLVIRKRDTKDRRVIFVDITDSGRKFIKATPHLLHNRLHDTLNNLKQSEQIQIANSMEMLVNLLQK